MFLSNSIIIKPFHLTILLLYYKKAKRKQFNVHNQVLLGKGSTLAAVIISPFIKYNGIYGYMFKSYIILLAIFKFLYNSWL